MSKPRVQIDWDKVFELRCRSKRGMLITEGEQRLLDAAYKADRRRYGAMEREVFEQTRPFGAARRAQDRGAE